MPTKKSGPDTSDDNGSPIAGRSMLTRARARAQPLHCDASGEELHDMQIANNDSSSDQDLSESDMASLPALAGRAADLKSVVPATRPNHKRPLPVVKSPAAKKPLGRSTVTQALSIHDALQASRVNVKATVRDWIQHTAKDSASGVYSLVLLLLRSAGYNGLFSYTAFQEPDVASILSNIQSSNIQHFVKDYPLQARGKGLKAYRRHFVDFFSALVGESSQGLLFEQSGKMIQDLLSWTIAMSSCHYRPFRVASTLAGLTMTQALCLAARTCHTQLNRMQKAAGASSKDQRNILARIELLQTQLEVLFNGIFVHRYRDVDSSVRSLCIESLGSWIETYPETFLDNSYLRYLGWVLSDKAAETRLSAVKSFTMLIEHQSAETAIASMRSFIERFRPRLIEMCTRDKDLRCQMAALTLVSHLRRYDLLDRDSEPHILELVFSSNVGVCTAAGAVLASCLKCGPIVERWRDAHVFFPGAADPVHLGVLRNEFILFKSIIDWSLSYLGQQSSRAGSEALVKLNAHTAALIVDSLWETYHAELSNVSSWFQYLTMDHSKSLAELPVKTHLWTLLSSAEEEAALIYFIDAAMKKTAKSTSAPAEFQKTCTVEILSAWSLILGQYRSAHATLCAPLSWLSMPAIFSPSILLSLPKEWLETLSELYSSVRDIFLMPVSTELQSTVWRACIKIFKAGFESEPAFRSEKLSFLREIFAALVAALRDGPCKQALVALGRLEALLVYFDVRSLFPCEFQELEQAVGELGSGAKAESSDLQLQLVKTCYRMLLWDLVSTTRSQRQSHVPDDAAIHGQVDRLVSHIMELVSPPDVCSMATAIACLAIYSDILIVFRGFESVVPEPIVATCRLPPYLSSASKEGALLISAFEETADSILRERVSAVLALDSLLSRVSAQNGQSEREAFLSSYAKLFVQRLLPIEGLSKLIKYVGMLSCPYAASFASLVSLVLDQGFDEDDPESPEAFSLPNFYRVVALSLIGSFQKSDDSFDSLMSLGKYLHGHVRQVTPQEKALQAMRCILEPLMSYIRAHLDQTNILVFFQVLTAQPWLSLLNITLSTVAAESLFSMQLVSLPLDALAKLCHVESYENFKKGLESKLGVLGQKASSAPLSVRTRNQVLAQMAPEATLLSAEPQAEKEMMLSPILWQEHSALRPPMQAVGSGSVSHSPSCSSGDQSNFWTLKSDEEAPSPLTEPDENSMATNKKRRTAVTPTADAEPKKSKQAASQATYEFPTSPVL